MDKARHPNVIRTWNMRRPVPILPAVKNEITRQIPVRGVPQPQKAPTSRFESREALGASMITASQIRVGSRFAISINRIR
jgi:hypothetical protein